MTKLYAFDEDLKNKLLEGAGLLERCVGNTLGPAGRNVILQNRNQGPFITKDGATVSSRVESNDSIINLAIQIIRQASEQTNKNAGDGTTTSTLLACALFREAQKFLDEGHSPVEIRKQMDSLADDISLSLLQDSIDITTFEQLQHIATVSSNGDEDMGEVIAKAIDDAGKKLYNRQNNLY